jgi:hypothetical protein
VPPSHSQRRCRRFLAVLSVSAALISSLLLFLMFSLKKLMRLALRTRYTTSRKMLHQKKFYRSYCENVDKKLLKQAKESNI